MLKLATTAGVALTLAASAQGAQLRTRAAAEAALSAGDRGLMRALAAKYDCADTSKTLVQHLHDIKDHSQTALNAETAKCEQQEQDIQNKMRTRPPLHCQAAERYERGRCGGGGAA